jgi:hypothetical protein
MSVRLASPVLATAALVLALSAFQDRVRAAPPPADAKVHALVVVDSLDPTIGKSVALDGDMVKDALTAGFKGHEDRLALTLLQGADATPAKVTAYYRDLKVGPTDTVLFYFSGHGATHSRRGHIMALGDKAVFRADLLEVIARKKPRLTVCLTDCCAVLFGGKPEVSRDLSFSWPTVQSLFLRHSGVVDINACSIGECAYCDAKGSVFTRGLIAGLAKAPHELGGESTDYVHWDDFFRYVRKRTEDDFAVMKAADRDIERDAKQVPQAFLLPTHRLGVVGKDGTDGLLVTRVYRGSPAEGAGFRAGDTILKVGNAAIRSGEDLEQALEKVGGSAAVVVRAKGATEPTTRTVRLSE